VPALAANNGVPTGVRVPLVPPMVGRVEPSKGLVAICAKAEHPIAVRQRNPIAMRVMGESFTAEPTKRQGPIDTSAPCFHKPSCLRIVDTMRTGSGSSPARKARGHSAETQSQRSDLLQPLSLSRAQLDRTVLQPDQAMSVCRNPIHKLAANYLAFIKLASIRIWLRAYKPAL
jgi:hypothetical protein